MKAKGHDLKFKQAKWCGGGGFIPGFWSHWDLPVATGQFKSGQDCCGTNILKDLFHEGHGVGVEPTWLSFAKVYTETQPSILLFNQNYGLVEGRITPEANISSNSFFTAS